MDFPKDQMEFEKAFSTEEKCVEYLIKLRWADGYSCLLCDCKEYWIASRKRIKCKECGNLVTVTAGTLLEQTNKPVSLWFRAIWWMIAQKSGASAVTLQSILGLGSYKTAWVWLHKLREIMILPERKKLSGIVEVGETMVGGGAEGKRGRGAENKSVVVVGAEALPYGTGRARMKRIKDASGKELETFIQENIECGATIITDGWKGYSGVSQLKFIHQIHQQNKAVDKEEMLPNVHRIASLLKRWLMGTHQNFVSERRLQSYLDEFTFRYNRRKSKSRGLLFYRILEQVVKHKPIHNKSVLDKGKANPKIFGGKK